MKRVAVLSLAQVGPGRFKVMRDSFKRLGRLAGIKFDHYVLDNGCCLEALSWLRECRDEGKIKHLEEMDQNVGISIGLNILLDEAQGYDYYLKFDPDCWPRTRAFLKKMVAVADKIRLKGGYAVIGPQVDGLLNPVPKLHVQDGSSIGLPAFTLEGVKLVGGICALYPKQLFEREEGDPWRHNPRLPKGSGQDEEIAHLVDTLTKEEGMWGVIRVREIRVEHALGTAGQYEKFADEMNTMEYMANRHYSFGI